MRLWTRCCNWVLLFVSVFMTDFSRFSRAHVAREGDPLGAPRSGTGVPFVCVPQRHSLTPIRNSPSRTQKSYTGMSIFVNSAKTLGCRPMRRLGCSAFVTRARRAGSGARLCNRAPDAPARVLAARRRALLNQVHDL